jgi:hypothetical protein
MNKVNIKKIIAREGLVVLGLLVLGFVIFLIWSILIPLSLPKLPFTYKQIQNEPNKYEFTIAGNTYQIEKKGKVTKQDLYKTAAIIAEQETIIRPMHLYNLLSDSKNIGLFIGFGGGYLFYLFIRSIIWFIKMLKVR